MVLGQRAVYALGAADRGRLNALYRISILLVVQSVLRWPVRFFECADWLAIAAVGSALSLLALVVFSMVSRRAKQAH